MKTLLKTISPARLIALPLTGTTLDAVKEAINKKPKVVIQAALDGGEKREAVLRNVYNVKKPLCLVPPLDEQR